MEHKPIELNKPLNWVRKVDVRHNEIRDSIPMPTLISTFMELERVESNPPYYQGDCIFCNHKNSFTVSTIRNVFYCFNCQINGDQVDFVQKIKKFDEQQAIKYLAEHFEDYKS